MAGVTVVSGGQMPGRHEMAGGTQTNDLRVVHPLRLYRCPFRGILVMTGVAYIAGAEMQRRFPAGGEAIVTIDAITGKQGVIRRRRRQPGKGVMT